MLLLAVALVPAHSASGRRESESDGTGSDGVGSPQSGLPALVPVQIGNFKTVLTSTDDVGAIALAGFSVMALSVGMCLDGARYLITWVIAGFLGIKRKRRAPYSLERMSKDETSVIDWVITNHFRFHQAFGNLALACTGAFAVWLIGGTSWKWLIGLSMVLLVLLAAAIGTYIDTKRFLKDRYPLETEKDERNKEKVQEKGIKKSSKEKGKEEGKEEV